MPVVASAQFTIVDTNDYYSVGAVAPTNPIANITTWLDTSVSPNQLKKWNGTSWEIVNEVVIGGRNLILGTNKDYAGWLQFGAWSVVNSNLFAVHSNYQKAISNTVAVKAGAYYTAQVNVVGANGNYAMQVYDVTNSIEVSRQYLGTTGKKIVTFKADANVNIQLIFFGISSTSGACTINNIKLETGNQATDWSPAPEDTQAQLDAITSDNVLSKAEKPGELTRWNDAVAAKAQLNGLATTYSITTENTTYNTAFQALANYLNNGTTWTSGTPSWLASLTTDTTIVGTTYRTKWNDYRVAEEALRSAIAAKAKGALDTIADIANDDKITPAEKKVMKIDFDAIYYEVSGIWAQADAFGVNRDTFTTKYNTLIATGISTQFLNMTTTWDLGAGGGAALRLKFREYYDARTALLNAIATKAKTLADAAQNTASNTANLFNFAPWYENDFTINNGNLVSKGKNNLKITSTGPGCYTVTYGAFGSNFRYAVFPSTKYTLSFKKKYNTTGLALVLYYTNQGDTSYLSFNSTDETSLTFTTPSNCNYVDFRFGIASSGQTEEFYDIMLVKGETAVSWVASSYDMTRYAELADYLRAAFEGSTDITGGILATNVLLMKNTLNQIVAGLSGLTGDNVASWSGGTYAQAVADAAREFKSAMETVGLDRKDGAGHRAKGNFAWNAAGDVYVRGLIEALLGKIGDFDIIGGTIGVQNVQLTKENIEPLSTLLTPNTLNYTSQESWTNTATSRTIDPAEVPIWVNMEARSYTQVMATPTSDSQLKFRVGGTNNFYTRTNDCRRLVKVRKNSVSGEIVYTDDTWGINVTSATSLNKDFQLNLPAGSYVVELILQASVLVEYLLNPVTFSTTANISGYSGTSQISISGYYTKTKIGNNGFYSFWSNLIHLYMSQTDGLVYKGPSNMPGVLASANVAANGTVSSQFGAMFAGAEKTGTGTYKVYHTIPHTDFVATASVKQQARAIWIGAQTAYNGTAKSGYVIITTTAYTGSTNLDSPFSFILSGNN